MKDDHLMSGDANQPVPEGAVTGGERLAVGSSLGDEQCEQEDARAASSVLQRTGPPEKGGEFPEFVHSYLREFIALADQKAGFLFAILAAVLAYTLGKGGISAFLKAPSTWSGTDLWGVVAIVGLTIGAVLTGLVVTPRLNTANDSGERHRGLIFWEDIRRVPSASDYCEKAGSLSVEQSQREILQHCFELAGVCESEYRVLTAALWVGAVSLVAVLLFVLFSTAAG